MARKTEWVFEVTGGEKPFPLDMLRYDGATPASSEDSRLIEQSVRGFTPPNWPKPWVIKLRSNVHAPTQNHWAAAGWIVTGEW